MNKCQIIKSAEQVAKWESEIKKRIKNGNMSSRQYLFFLLGLGTGLQTTELVQIKFEDLHIVKRQLNDNEQPQEIMYILLKSKLTRGKMKEIIFPEKCKNMIKEFRLKYPEDLYLFQNKAVNAKKDSPTVWSSFYIYQFLTESARASGITKGTISATTLRKTFGYFQLKYGDWSLLKLKWYFDMRSINLLKEYLGITDEDIIADKD